MTASVTLVGNITRDPELRFTPSGKATCTFGLAVNRRWMNRQTNDWEERVSFFNIVCWGDLADNVAESLNKGTRIVVTGRLEQRNWETQEGEKRNMIEVVADDLGPSLRWSTAVVNKADRRDPSAGGGVGPTAARSGGGQPEYPYDEEPF